MQVGDLVRLSPCDYPQYRGQVGILMSDEGDGLWKVFIKGRLHKYLVNVNITETEVINASGRLGKKP